MICKKCGAENHEETRFCVSCGANMGTNDASSQWAVIDDRNENSIVSMVLGIVSILLSFCCGSCGGIVSIIFGIIGLYLVNTEKKKGDLDGFAKAGLVCSIIGIVLSVLCFIWSIFYIGAVGFGVFTELVNSL